MVSAAKNWAGTISAQIGILTIFENIIHFLWIVVIGMYNSVKSYGFAVFKKTSILASLKFLCISANVVNKSTFRQVTHIGQVNLEECNCLFYNT